MEKERASLSLGRTFFSINKSGRIIARNKLSGDFENLVFLSSSEYSGQFPRVAKGLKAEFSNVRFIEPEDFLAGLRPILQNRVEERGLGRLSGANDIFARGSVNRLTLEENMIFFSKILKWLDCLAIAW